MYYIQSFGLTVVARGVKTSTERQLRPKLKSYSSMWFFDVGYKKMGETDKCFVRYTRNTNRVENMRICAVVLIAVI